jgi:hypothetical protein
VITIHKFIGLAVGVVDECPQINWIDIQSCDDMPQTNCTDTV